MACSGDKTSKSSEFLGLRRHLEYLDKKDEKEEKLKRRLHGKTMSDMVSEAAKKMAEELYQDVHETISPTALLWGEDTFTFDQKVYVKENNKSHGHYNIAYIGEKNLTNPIALRVDSKLGGEIVLKADDGDDIIVRATDHVSLLPAVGDIVILTTRNELYATTRLEIDDDAIPREELPDIDMDDEDLNPKSFKKAFDKLFEDE